MFIDFVFMSDTHYGRRPGERSDYTLWGKLLRTAYEKAWPESAGSSQVVSLNTDTKRSALIVGADSAVASDKGKPLLVLGGDLVNRPEHEEEWDMFFDAGGETLQRMQVITATGNRRSNPSVSYEGRFDLPGNGPAGFEHLFYSYDYGCCHFLVLDSGAMGPEEMEPEEICPKRAAQEHGYSQEGKPGRESGCGRQSDHQCSCVNLIRSWIRRDLASCLQRNPQAAIFAVMHHPMITAGTSEEDERRAQFMRGAILPLLESFHVDMILCGHQHLYCRSKRIEDTGMIQLMTVSGTKYFDGRDLSQMECVREFVSAATIFHVGEGEIRLQAIDAEGTVLDELNRPVRKKFVQQHSFNAK